MPDSPATIPWRPPFVYAGLFLAWAVFAAWQYHQYEREQQLAREVLRGQSHSVMNALIGGARSHRRLGRFFQEQLQGMLDELVKSEDVLAVAVSSRHGGMVLSAGRTELLDTLPRTAGESWEGPGFRLVEQFELAPISSGPPWTEGGGPGRGRGRRRAFDNTDDETAFSEGGTFVASLILDRARADAQCRRAAWSFAFVVAAGALVLACVALAWGATVRMVAARGRAQALELEARHLRELSQAAAGLAHETRNPLGLVRGWAQQLAQGSVDTGGPRERAQAMVEECDRITSRINQFLAYARPRAPKLETIDPAHLIEQLADLLRPDLEAKQLKLTRRVVQPGQGIRADREMLRQALFNLAQNAIQFSPEGETVEISVDCGQDGTCSVEVADRGPGVAPEAVDSLFTPYHTTRPDGTGLGLAIVSRIASAHGWQVEYVPRPDGGAVFRLGQIRG